MTRLGFLSAILVALDPDRGPTTKAGNVTVTHRGVLYCTLPGDEQGPYPPLLIENNSIHPAQITYRGQTWTVPGYSTSEYDT